MSLNRSITIKAPSKVNWYLNILGKRKDGYHNLETIFVRLPLHDRIRLTATKGGIVLETKAPIPKGPENLAYKAAALLQKDASISLGVKIFIKKAIPMEAGLGGGSSDAAAVLVGLNRLWRLGYSLKRLSKLGAQVGSDVPFFVSEARYALGRGRGERIHPIWSSRRLWHVLIKPPFGISTRQAYQDYARLSRQKPGFLTPPRGGAKILLRFLQGRVNKIPQDGFFNSLELALNKRVTEISKLKNLLIQQGASAALLSGSGSTVFGVFGKKGHAIRAVRFLKRRKGCQVFVV